MTEPSVAERITTPRPAPRLENIYPESTRRRAVPRNHWDLILLCRAPVCICQRTFMNPVAIEGHLTLVLIQWMIIIAAAYILGRLGKRFLHQPLAVGEIAAGILLGPSALGAIWPSMARFLGDAITRLFN